MDEVGCLDEDKNVFYARLGERMFIVRQPTAVDRPLILEALKLASEYTVLRYPRLIWRHSEGVCHMPYFKPLTKGFVYFMMILDGKVVGFSNHTYWVLGEKTQRQMWFPVPVGSFCGNVELCVLDPYQRQGVASVYAKVSEYIAKHNGANFIMGETYKKGGMLNIRMRDGWTSFGERKLEDGTTRIVIGRAI